MQDGAKIVGKSGSRERQAKPVNEGHISFQDHQHAIQMAGFRDMVVYQKAFKLAALVFHLTKRFPREELFGLTSQVRNSSRSTCANFGEAYRRRRYKAHLVSKLTDSDAENTETQIHLDMAVACGYVAPADVAELN